MNLQFDAAIVDTWTEFIRLQEQGAIDLDEKSRSIIYAVAAAETRGEKINQNGLLKALKPKSHMPILSRLNVLIQLGWLAKEVDATDGRMKIVRLTPKSIAMLNLMSKTIRSAVKTYSAIAAGIMALLWDFENSPLNLFATQVLHT